MTTNFKFPETDIIGCRFPTVTGCNGKIVIDNTSKEYSYKLLPGMDTHPLGAFVVVSCVNGFQVCVVTTLNATSSFDDLAYVVGTVNVDAYLEELERQKQKKALHAQLLKKKKELEEAVTWDMLAERSPEFKSLLDAYRNL